MKKYTDEFLLSELRRFYDENGRSPKQKDICVTNGYPYVSIYKKCFGGFNKALKCAGLPVNHVSQYSKDELISELYRFVEEYDRIPKYDEMDKARGYPSCQAYRDTFVTWNDALTDANLGINIIHEYNIDFLINELYRFVDENNRVPTQNELRVENGYPSYTVYVKKFGSFNNALKYSGLNPNRILHEYDGTEVCSMCGADWTYRKWNYDDDDNRLCSACDSKIWRQKNPNKVKKYKHTHDSKRRHYGATTLNGAFSDSNGHHLFLENNTTFSIFIPEFLHKLYYHNHNKSETMVTINAIALDFWLNESFYQNLYLTGDVSGS